MFRLQRVTERVIQRLKGDAEYRLEGTYLNGELQEALLRRGMEIYRGLWLGRGLRRARPPLFAGRRISVRSGSRIVLGRADIIGDDVVLDGMSERGIRVGDNVTIGRGSTLTCAGVLARPGLGIEIGDRTGIGEYAHIGGQGGVRIGSDVICGPAVRIFSENHRFSRLDQVIRKQGEDRSEVVIGDDCWIGSNVTILAGVHIGSGAVIAAGAVVTRDVGPRCVVAGVPARVLSVRGSRE